MLAKIVSLPGYRYVFDLLFPLSFKNFKGVSRRLFSTSFSFFGQYVNELFSIFLSEENQTSVEDKGFEPLTPCLQSRCSSQLS